MEPKNDFKWLLWNARAINKTLGRLLLFCQKDCSFVVTNINVSCYIVSYSKVVSKDVSNL